MKGWFRLPKETVDTDEYYTDNQKWQCNQCIHLSLCLHHGHKPDTCGQWEMPKPVATPEEKQEFTEAAKAVDDYVDDYTDLRRILGMAFAQSATGKGKERHANGKPWTEQPIIVNGREFRGGCLFQAVKKCQESQRRDKDGAIMDLLGAINYIAAEIYLRENED